MRGFIKTIGLGLGLTLGGSLVYALYISEAARLLLIFVGGALMFGAVILVTVYMINRQWIKSMGEQRTIHNYRYQVGQPAASPPPVYQSQAYYPELPPPPAWGANGQSDDDLIA